ncbi:hypothetical protein [uncultured Clostridium sp.]|uniref:hypothetical protein n=1 Tax=uncultured Clostridium sp. TaxID=59620 RepID=UPI00261BDF7E|nr:hypothetical protein [uncultured Clostridium sp.]
MSNYIMNVRKKLKKEEYGNICDYLGIISKHDEFTMQIEDVENINFDIINKIFEENNVVKVGETIYENGECIIKGNKK